MKKGNCLYRLKGWVTLTCTFALVLVHIVSFGQQSVSLSSLLKDMIDVRSVAQWPNPNYVLKQASSYDRHSKSPSEPGWFANADFSQYIRIEEKAGHKEAVMLDADGPGAIVRFWLTTFKREGVLRIYFDNEDKAAIEIPAYDLMKSGLNLGTALLNPHSSYQPKEKGGSTLYLPLPYAKHCKITWEDQDIKDPQPRYYQINYRTYDAEVIVKTFDLQQLEASRGLIKKVENALWNPPSTAKGTRSMLTQRILPGKAGSLTLPAGPSCINLMNIIITAEKEANNAQALRSTIIKITFDGHETVWCPVGDFSGSGVGGKPLQSWYRTVKNDGEIISRWAMPFKKTAVVSLINLGDAPINISLATLVSKYKWDASSMYFHASWRQTRQQEIFKYDTEKAVEWNFNTINGKGVYLGNTMSVFNHMHTWYGEGDQKIWVDKDTFPSEFGTGTEDYYNTSWAPVVLYQTPFANAPRADNNDSFGYNTFTRTRILDAVPFNNNFRMDMEMLGWQHGTADFAATTYWYGFDNATDNAKEMETEARSLLPQ